MHGSDSAATPAAERSTSAEELAELRQQLEAERREKNAFKSRAETAERRAGDAQARVFASEEAAVANALAAAEAEAAKAEEDLAKAYEEGRTAEIGKLTRAVSTAQYKVEVLRGQQFRIEEAKKRAPEPTGEDPRLAGFTEPTKAWIKKHPAFLEQGAFYNRVMAAHYAAVADGMQTDTPEYFDFIEEKVGLREPAGGRREEGGEREGQQEEEAEVTTESPLSQAARTQEGSERRRTPAASRAAPPARQAPRTGQPRQTGQQIRLTPEEAEAARFSFPEMSEADAYAAYAENKRALIAAGKIGGGAR